MIRIYQKYLAQLFLKKVFIIFGVFLCLTFILSVFEEIGFFKDSEVHWLYPFFLTFLNTPATLFEIFPFIFLIASQFFFIELIEKNELEFLKIHGLNNIKILKIISITSIILGFLLIVIFYHFSSKLKFIYFDLKNGYSKDDKYLAVVTENGLWFKDEIYKSKYIVNAKKIENNFLKDVSITEFDEDFKLIRVIESLNVDISSLNWIIYKPSIYIDNLKSNFTDELVIETHFNQKKITSLFRNLSSLSIFELKKLKKDYENLGYDTSNISSHLNRIYSLPFYLSIMSLFSGILMLNIKRNKPIYFHIILGILSSVLIYYFYYLFNIMGENGKIPILTAVWLPLFILMIIISIGLVRVNEK